MTALTAAAAKARAAALVGSDDFGPPGFEEGLERALATLARLPLKPDVMTSAMDRIVEDLANRLRIEQWYKTHPAIADEVIGFEMPGATMAGFRRNSMIIAKAGIYDLRLHHDDVDAERGELHAHRVAQPLDRELGRVVPTAERLVDLAADRRDVHDPALAAPP